MYTIRLKSEGDGTIAKELSLSKVIVELSHQFKTGLWESDDVYQVVRDGDVESEIDYDAAKKLF